jgi:hypothetical protein
MACARIAPILAASLLIGCGAARSSPSQPDAGEPFSRLEGSGFCRPGTDEAVGLPEGDWVPTGLRIVGSHCPGSETETGTLAGTPFQTADELTLFIGGYVDSPGLGLAIEATQSGKRLKLKPFPAPNRAWRYYTFALPPAWRNSAVRLVAWDHSKASDAWFAFSEPVVLGSERWHSELRAFSILSLVAAVQLGVFALPFLAICVVCVRRGVRGAAQLSLALLLALGLAGYAMFWLYLAHRAVGIAASAMFLVSGGIYVWRWRRQPGYREEKRILASLAPPLRICLALTALVLYLGFSFGGIARPQDAAAQRFSHRLPSDNNIPKVFADGLFNGHIDRPLASVFLSSDRPPLQAGIFLLQRAFVGGTVNLTYQILSVFLQTLWILGVWVWLSAARIGRKPAMLIVAAGMCWGLTLINEFFVWPKLFPTAYVLAVFACLFTPETPRIRNSARAGLVTGAAGALAMLSHGVSVYAMAGFGLALLLTGKLPGWRFIFAALGALALLYVPWMAYQAFYDPPGNALVKIHLAGAETFDARSSLRVIADAYAALSPAAILQNKWANVQTIVGSPARMVSDLGHLLAGLGRFDLPAATQAANSLRRQMFYSVFPAVGLLAIGPLILAVGACSPSRRTPEFTAAVKAWCIAAVVIAVWATVQFGPGTTINVTGPYAVPLLLAAGALLGAWAISPALAAGLAAAHMGLNVLLYVVLIPGSESDTAIGTAVNPFCAGAAIVAALLLAWLLWKEASTGAPLGEPAL